MNIAIFGAGAYGKYLGNYIIKTEDKLVAYIDNDVSSQGQMVKVGNEEIRIYSVDDICHLNLDLIIIAIKFSKQVKSVKEQLKKINVAVKVEVMIENAELIKNAFIYTRETCVNRVTFLRDFARYAEDEKLEGCVAECGVYRGDFAYFINKYFCNRKFYLIDTFEGFSEDDVDIEKSLEDIKFLQGEFANEKNQFRTNIDLVEVINKKMPYIEKCIIKKGYFPDSAADISDIFCFVNLDMDLYKPMYDGIKFFYPKMCRNGIILLHDYYHESLPGVKKAVEDIEKEQGEKFYKFPIGDGCSLAIIKIR